MVKSLKMRYKCDFYIKLFVFEKFMRYFCTLNFQLVIRNRDLVYIIIYIFINQKRENLWKKD